MQRKTVIGVGIELRLGSPDSADNGLLVVQDVTKNGPAYNAGVRPLDRITEIDGKTTSALPRGLSLVFPARCWRCLNQDIASRFLILPNAPVLRGPHCGGGWQGALWRRGGAHLLHCAQGAFQPCQSPCRCGALCASSVSSLTLMPDAGERGRRGCEGGVQARGGGGQAEGA